MPRPTSRPTPRGRRAARALAASALAAACLTAALTSSASAAATPRCGVAALEGSFADKQAGAGNRYATLVLTNTTKATCALFGYPGGQLLGSRGQDLPTKIVRDRSKTPKAVVLLPDKSARSQFHWGAIAGAGEPQRGPCEATPKRVEITPPNATRFLVLPWGMGPVCERGEITVGPMAK